MSQLKSIEIRVVIPPAVAIRASRAEYGETSVPVTEVLPLLSEEAREWLASTLSYDGRLSNPVMLDTPQVTAQTVTAALQRVAAEELAQVAAAIALPDDRWLTDAGCVLYPELKCWMQSHPQVIARIAGLQEEAERRKASRAAAKAAQEAAEEATKAAVQRERAEWIAQHGSLRLQRLVAEGIEHSAVYYDERLAFELPGWVWYNSVSGDYADPRNAPASALALLDRARAVAPAARLVYWKHEEHEDYDPYRTCVLECEQPEWRGYVAVVTPPWVSDREAVFGVFEAE